MRMRMCFWCAINKIAARYGVDPEDDEAVADFFYKGAYKLSKFAQSWRISLAIMSYISPPFPIEGEDCEICHGVVRRNYGKGTKTPRLSESPEIEVPEGALFSEPKKKKPSTLPGFFFLFSSAENRES